MQGSGRSGLRLLQQPPITILDLRPFHDQGQLVNAGIEVFAIETRPAMTEDADDVIPVLLPFGDDLVQHEIFGRAEADGRREC